MPQPKKITVATQRSLTELTQLLEQFPDWEVWKETKYFPLNTKEKFVLQAYLKHKTHHVAAKVKGLSIRQIASIYHNAIKKLKQPLTHFRYEKWAIYQFLYANQLCEQDFDIDSVIEPPLRITLPAPLLLQLINAANENSILPINQRMLGKLKVLNAMASSSRELKRNHLCIELFVSLD